MIRGGLVLIYLGHAARIGFAWWLAERWGFSVLSWAQKPPQPVWLAVSLGAAAGLCGLYARQKWMPIEERFEKAGKQSADFVWSMATARLPVAVFGAALWSTSIEIFYRGLIFQWLAEFAFGGALGLMGALGAWVFVRCVFLSRLRKTERPQMLVYMLLESVGCCLLFWWSGTIAATVVSTAIYQFFTFYGFRTLARRAEGDAS